MLHSAFALPLAVFLFFCLICRTSAFGAAPSLRLVHALWRHGDRIPINTFPNDGANASQWKEGIGELTNLGMNQHFQLGQFIRNNYGGFISDEYSSFEIYVRSTDTNRTIASAMANLAGIFPNSSGQPGTRAWQVIPVHSVPSKYDNVVNVEGPCPAADKEFFVEIQNSDEVLELMEKYSSLFRFLRHATGFELPVFNDIWKVYDILNVQLIHNSTDHQWPRWMTGALWQEIELANDISKSVYYKRLSMQRLRGGPLLNDILQRMTQKANNEVDPRLKLYAYSGVGCIAEHDLTVLALLENLGAWNGRLPPYASAVFLELHERSEKFFVELYYRNATDQHEPFPLAIEGCPSPCELSQFRERSLRHITNDWNGECQISSAVVDKQDLSLYFVAAMISLAIVAGLLLLAVVFLSVKLRSLNKHMNKVAQCSS